MVHLESGPFSVIFQYNLYNTHPFFPGARREEMREEGDGSSLNRVITGCVIRSRLCITTVNF